MDWSAAIVLILKSDKKSVCICGYFKQTVKVDSYPIPKIEDLFAELAGENVFEAGFEPEISTSRVR